MSDIKHHSGSDMRWWKVFWFPLFCYLPALLITIVNLWIFKSENASSQDLNKINQPLTELQIKQIEEEVNKALNRRLEELEEALAQQEAIAEGPNSIIAKGYIDGQIKQEVQDQVEEAAKVEIDKLKADWKGDLFSQISFPMVSIIVSIFAAFAVKDILTEILKRQERDRISNELEKELETKMVPKAIKSNQKELNDHLESIESYTYWLEYELLSIEINQMIDDCRKSSKKNSKEMDGYILPAIEKFFDRASFALEKASGGFRNKELELIKKSEHEVLETKFESIGLSDTARQYIGQLGNKFKNLEDEQSGSELGPEIRFVRMEHIFQIQMRLLRATLWKLQEDGNASNKKSNLIAEIENYVSIDWTKRYKENKEKARQARLDSNVKLPPLELDD